MTSRAWTRSTPRPRLARRTPRRRALDERHRLDQAEATIADIGQPRRAVDRQAQHHMRAHPAIGRAVAHPRQKRRDGEPQVTKRRREQRVVLEAIAATSLVEELPLEVAERQADSPALLNREVFESKLLPV